MWGNVIMEHLILILPHHVSAMVISNTHQGIGKVENFGYYTNNTWNLMLTQ